MDTRYLVQARTHARGAVKPVFVAIVVVIALLAASAWFLIFKPHQQLMLADTGGHALTRAPATARSAPPPPVDVGAMDMNQLLDEARKGINDQRYLAPAGNNAFEFYLRVLQKQPGNQVATDALRETFPFAATQAEQAINARDFNGAQREIDLLAKADPTNFTLTILRSKLDAQRKTLDKQQQDALEQQKAQQVAAQRAAAEKTAVEQQASTEQVAAEQKAKQEQTPAAKPAPQPSVQPTSRASAAGEVVAAESRLTGKNSEAVLLTAVAPTYPSAALRARQSGSVELAFTIDPDGRTSSIEILSSQPRHIFDRAAINAIRAYRFTPAMRDGVAVSSKRKQKIDFNL